MKRLTVVIAGILLAAALVGIVIHQTRYVELPADVIADRVVIEKSARRLTIFAEGKRLKSYSVSLGPSPEGHKQFEGDGRTPEGQYVIDRRKADSSFHLALHISYPETRDVQFAQLQGLSPGGDIMIHGIRNGLGVLGPIHRTFDWTQGCIAVTDAEIEELWRAVPDGTPIDLRP
jgi:murein L,D-transpeptidase YafK